MAQTQFFKRESGDIEEYKSTFNKALQKIKTVKLFSEEVIIFLQTWIDAQKNYIPRDDIDNFGGHLEKIFSNKNFYEFIVQELKTVKNNGKIQEYSFNLISQLDDSAKKFEDSEKKRKNQESIEKSKQKAKLEDEEEMERILNEL